MKANILLFLTNVQTIGTLRIFFYDNVQVLIAIVEIIDILIQLLLMSHFYRAGPRILLSNLRNISYQTLWQLPQNKPSHQYRVIYKNTQKRVRHSRSIKTFEIQQYIGFFVIAGLLELFTVYVRPAMRDYQRGGEKMLKSKKSRGIIREAVLLERAALKQSGFTHQI